MTQTLKLFLRDINEHDFEAEMLSIPALSQSAILHQVASSAPNNWENKDAAFYSTPMAGYEIVVS